MKHLKLFESITMNSFDNILAVISEYLQLDALISN